LNNYEYSQVINEEERDSSCLYNLRHLTREVCDLGHQSKLGAGSKAQRSQYRYLSRFNGIRSKPIWIQIFLAIITWIIHMLKVIQTHCT